MSSLPCRFFPLISCFVIVRREGFFLNGMSPHENKCRHMKRLRRRSASARLARRGHSQIAGHTGGSNDDGNDPNGAGAGPGAGTVAGSPAGTVAGAGAGTVASAAAGTVASAVAGHRTESLGGFEGIPCGSKRKFPAGDSNQCSSPGKPTGCESGKCTTGAQQELYEAVYDLSHATYKNRADRSLSARWCRAESNRKLPARPSDQGSTESGRVKWTTFLGGEEDKLRDQGDSQTIIFSTPTLDGDTDDASFGMSML